MDKTKTIGIRIEPEKWDTFCFACQKYGKPPGDILRELIDHVDAAVAAIQARQLVMLDGDLAAFLYRRFPGFNPQQWRFMAGALAEIADIAEGISNERG